MDERSPSPDKPSKMQFWKDFANTLQSGATITALIVGGWWTYHLFIQQRQEYPVVKIAQTISHRMLNKDFNLLLVDETFKNEGHVFAKIDPKDGQSGFLQVIPIIPKLPCVCPEQNSVSTKSREQKLREHLVLTPAENADFRTCPTFVRLSIPVEGQFVRLEPGEEDHLLYPVCIPSDVRTVGLFSWVYKGSDHKEVWNDFSVYDVATKPARAATENDIKITPEFDLYGCTQVQSQRRSQISSLHLSHPKGSTALLRDHIE